MLFPYEVRSNSASEGAIYPAVQTRLSIAEPHFWIMASVERWVPTATARRNRPGFVRPSVPSPAVYASFRRSDLLKPIVARVDRSGNGMCRWDERQDMVSRCLWQLEPDDRGCAPRRTDICLNPSGRHRQARAIRHAERPEMAETLLGVGVSSAVISELAGGSQWS